MNAPLGIDGSRITTWFQKHVPHCEPPLRFRRFSGGKSNLTFAVLDSNGHKWVLRRPPLHSAVPSAHDVSREFRILSALADTPVPVPRVIGLGEADRDVPFYVAEYVEGIVVREEDDATKLSPTDRRDASEALVDALATLHSLEPKELGLAELGPTSNYVSRQLRTWHRQWQHRHPDGRSTIDRVHTALAKTIPPQTRPRIVHGDYKLANVILALRGGVQAVLDWELCTLGEPVADLGLLIAYWPDPTRQPAFAMESAPTHMGGFLTPRALVDRYSKQTNADLSYLPYYRGLAYWKLAVIIDGVYARHAAGAYGDTSDNRQMAVFRQAVEELGEAAELALAEDT